MRWFTLALAGAFALLAATTSCTPAADDASAGGAKEGLEVGNKFPHYDTFSAETIDGKPIKFSDYKGKLLFLDFWASWCGPCEGELPYVRLVQDASVGDKFAIVGISLDQSLDDLRAMAKEFGLTYPQICDEKGWRSKYATMFNINSIPANFLLDGNGVILATSLRGLALEGHVAKALGEDKPSVAYADTMDYLRTTDEPDADKAMALLKKALDADPEQPEFQFLAAQISIQAGKLDEAIEHYEIGLEHRDKLPVFQPALYAYVTLGQLHLHQGDKDKAVKALDDVIAAIKALGEEERGKYTRYLPDLEKLKTQWSSGGGGD